jgi:potassium channel subfamily K, invertebrate
MKFCRLKRGSISEIDIVIVFFLIIFIIFLLFDFFSIGIPLFLMCIANISGVLGDMFRYLYSRVCCRMCMKKKKPSQGFADSEGNRSAMGIAPVSQWTGKEANDKATSNTAVANSKSPAFVGNGGAKVVDDVDGIDNELRDDEETEKVTVPLTITMIIITLYILIGAVLFNQFEGWTLIQAGYFCFITLATIGLFEAI